MPAPKRRTLTVLASLVLAMTVATGLLLALEPAPTAPASGRSLSVRDQESDPESVLFNTIPSAKADRWTAIVIQHSGQSEGSLKTLHSSHDTPGAAGGGYHFVINNGSGKPDGEIEMSFRWQRQVNGDYASGKHADWFNKHAIGICIIGDPSSQSPTHEQMVELIWLVRRLQDRFNIAPDHIRIQASNDDPSVPAKLFPAAEFQQQILHPGNP